MATAAELALIISAKNEASKVLNDVNKQASGLGKTLGDVSKIAGGFVVGQGIVKLGGFLVDATKAAADDAASQARLKQAVENTGISFASFAEDIDWVISRGQKLGFTDDQTRDSLSLLAAQTGDSEEAVKRYALAQDLARGANIDVVTASKLLGKVTEDNVNVLARYGISVEKGASETELFAAVQQKFGGQAQAFADTTAGKMAILKDRMGELKETIGAALLPIMTKLADFAVAKLIPALEVAAAKYLPMLKKAFDDVAKVIQTLAPYFESGFKTIMAVVKPLFEFIIANKPLLIAAIAAIGVAIVIALGPGAVAVLAILGLITLIGWLKENFGALPAAIGAAVGEVRDVIVGAFNYVINWLQSNWPIIAILIAGPFLPLVALATDAFGVRSALEGAFGAVRNFIFGVINDIVGAISSAANTIINIVQGILNAVQTAIDAVNSIPTPSSVVGSAIPDLTPWDGLSPFATGTPFVPYDMPALIHKGEAIIPADQNPFNQKGGKSLGGGLSINTGPVTIINNGEQKDVRRSLADLAFGAAAELRSRGIPVYT